MSFMQRAIRALTGGAGSCGIEALEPRSMMAVTAAIDSISLNGTGVFAVVHYRSNQPIDLTTIGNNDIRLSAPARTAAPQQPAFTQAAVIMAPPVTQADGSVTATYFMYARGFAWDWGDTGTYTISMGANEVQDAAHTGTAGGMMGSYWFWFTTPRAEYQSGTLTGSSWNFSVVYSDDNALNLSSIGDGDAEVYGPGGWRNQIARATMTFRDQPIGNSVRVFYSAKVAQVGASWLNRGHYDIIMRGNQVSDMQGNAIPAYALASYWYWNDRPAAEMVSSTMSATAWNISVRYSDDHGINVSTIGNGDIVGASLVGAPVTNPDGSVVANYTIAAPAGGWNHNDGSTPLALASSQVLDMDGNTVAGGFLIPQTEYTWSAPTVAVASSNRVSANTWDVVVRVTDPDGLNLASLTSGRAFEVRGASNSAIDYGGYRSSLSVLSSAPTTGGYLVTLRLTSPGSAFAAGKYYLRTRSHEGCDVMGHMMASQELLAFTL